jgi:hypothetical protein
LSNNVEKAVDGNDVCHAENTFAVILTEAKNLVSSETILTLLMLNSTRNP